MEAPRLSRVVGSGPLALIVLALLAVVALCSHGTLHGSVFSAASLHQLQSPTRHTTAGHGFLRSAGPGPSASVHGSSSASGTLVPAWLAFVALVVLGGGTAAFLVTRFRERRRFAGADAAGPSASPGERADGSGPRDALRAAVDRSLAEVRADPNARRAIIGAYRLMELALAHAGLARASAEAPREYLGRTLASLQIGPEAPRRLTVLFERARFDRADLDLELRDEAVQALLALRSEL